MCRLISRDTLRCEIMPFSRGGCSETYQRILFPAMVLLHFERFENESRDKIDKAYVSTNANSASYLVWTRGLSLGDTRANTILICWRQSLMCRLISRDTLRCEMMLLATSYVGCSDTYQSIVFPFHMLLHFARLENTLANL